MKIQLHHLTIAMLAAAATISMASANPRPGGVVMPQVSVPRTGVPINYGHNAAVNASRNAIDAARNNIRPQGPSSGSGSNSANGATSKSGSRPPSGGVAKRTNEQNTATTTELEAKLRDARLEQLSKNPEYTERKDKLKSWENGDIRADGTYAEQLKQEIAWLEKGYPPEYAKLQGDLKAWERGDIQASGSYAEQIKQEIAWLEKGYPPEYAKLQGELKAHEQGRIMEAGGAERIKNEIALLEKGYPPEYAKLQSELRAWERGDIRASGTYAEQIKQEIAWLEKGYPPEYAKLQSELKAHEQGRIMEAGGAERIKNEIAKIEQVTATKNELNKKQAGASGQVSTNKQAQKKTAQTKSASGKSSSAP